MSIVARKMSTEEFEAYAARHEGRCELIRGEVHTLSPTDTLHAVLVARLTMLLASFVERNRLGTVLTGEPGFRLDDEGGPTVRAPDVAFLSADRFPAANSPKFSRVAPDLAAEILSPEDRASEVTEKVRWWLAHDVRIVWVVDPATRSVAVHEPGGRSRLLGEGDTLDGGEVVPGFEMPLAELFR